MFVQLRGLATPMKSRGVFKGCEGYVVSPRTFHDLKLGKLTASHILGVTPCRASETKR